MRRSRKVDEFEVADVADRLLAYGIPAPAPVEHDETLEDELVAKAVTLRTFMARNPPREKVEKLLSPDDPQR